MGSKVSAKIDLIGHTYGRLTVTKECGRLYGKVLWECVCSCGNTTRVTGNAMRRGNTLSCGCLVKESLTKHGLATTRPYKIWRGIMSRCLNKDAKDYWAYGGRGIIICEEWKNPKVFVEWAISNGYSPGLQIDRKNNNGNYCPDNCRWVTRIININNRGILINNKSGYTGVCFHVLENKFQASVYHKGKRYYIGYYHTAQEAAIARDLFIQNNNLPHKLQISRGEP